MDVINIDFHGLCHFLILVALITFVYLQAKAIISMTNFHNRISEEVFTLVREVEFLQSLVRKDFGVEKDPPEEGEACPQEADCEACLEEKRKAGHSNDQGPMIENG